MSQIDALLNEMCPAGVPFHTISEIFVTKNGYTPATSNKSFWKNGTVPWFRMEDIRENGGVLNDAKQKVTPDAVKGGRLFPANSIIVATSATIGEHALITVPHLSNQRFTSLSLRPEFAGHLDMKFAYYYCFKLGEWCRNNTTTSSFASVEMNGFKKFRFPIPPLEVQHKIVAILDSFTKLEARHAQYRYYRDTLLDVGGQTESKVATLGELYESSSGLSKAADQFGFGEPFLSFKTVFHNAVVPQELPNLVNTTEAEQRRYSIKKGDVFVTRTSEDLEGLGMSCAALEDHPKATFNGFTKRLRPKIDGVIDPQYAAYFFRSAIFRLQIAKMAILSTRVSLNDDILMRIRIPFPPLEEQKRIVSILDKFDALVNDLTNGLPAEINARRQQYEYYRDQLLTFKQAA